MEIECPLGLNQVHYPNCHFNRDGQCDYERIIEDPERAEKLQAEMRAELYQLASTATW